MGGNWSLLPSANRGEWGKMPVLELPHPRSEEAGALYNNLHLSSVEDASQGALAPRHFGARGTQRQISLLWPWKLLVQ